MTSIPQEMLLQVVSILLKVRIVECEEGEDPNNLSSDSAISLFTNYKNKKLRVNINVPMKPEMKVGDHQIFFPPTRLIIYNGPRAIYSEVILRSSKRNHCNL